MSSTLVVAEVSANHRHDFEIAKRTISAAAESGADAVKLQTYTADTITIDSKRPEFFEATNGTIWEGQSLYSLYREAFTPWEWHGELKDLSNSLGLTFFSSSFDRTAVDLLAGLSAPMYKIASFEITDIQLLEYAASKQKSMIISIGIADAGDIQRAVDACRRVGNHDITLLQTTSSYPAPIEAANLRMIPNLVETFGVKAGVSDHTLGSTVAVAAVALGATMVEKHFILDRDLGGPDAAFSMQPDEFKAMVDEIRIVEKALGRVDYSLTARKRNGRKFARSLFVVQDVAQGDFVTEYNVRSIRPGHGLHPMHLSTVLGRKFVRNIQRGEPLSWDMVQP